MNISTDYKPIPAKDLEMTARRLARAWKNENLPMRQFEACVQGELEAFLKGEKVPPYDAFIELINAVPYYVDILEVGASSGYYGEVLRIAEVPCRYTALDYSETWRDAAARWFPSQSFIVGDARQLPCEPESYDVVVLGGCLLHIYEYEQALAEAVRVAKEYVILHRMSIGPETRGFTKQAYGVDVFEWEFNEAEILSLCEMHGLTLVKTVDFGMKSYLFKK